MSGEKEVWWTVQGCYSWSPLEESVLGSLLFQVLINYLEWRMNNKALTHFCRW